MCEKAIWNAGDFDGLEYKRSIVLPRQENSWLLLLSRVSPRCPSPRPAWQAGTAAAASLRRPCRGPACLPGCPFRCSPGLPAPGFSLHLSRRRPAEKPTRSLGRSSATLALFQHGVLIRWGPEQSGIVLLTKTSLLCFLTASQNLLHPPGVPLKRHSTYWAVNTLQVVSTPWNKPIM